MLAVSTSAVRVDVRAASAGVGGDGLARGAAAERLRLVGEGGGIGQRGEHVRRARAGRPASGWSRSGRASGAPVRRRAATSGAEAVGRPRPSRPSREHARIVGARLERDVARSQGKIGRGQRVGQRAVRRRARPPQELRHRGGRARPVLRGRARRVLRPARPERRRQDHHHRDPRGAARADRGRGRGPRPALGHATTRRIRERIGVCLQETVLSEKLTVRETVRPLPQLLPPRPRAGRR